MAINTYGTIRPANFNPADSEIYLQYQKNISTPPDKLVKLNPTQVLEKTYDPEQTYESLGGLYNLKLNASLFSRGLGWYRISILNKRLNSGYVVIRDCGVLDDVDVKGIIVDLNSLDSEAQALFGAENALTGYRVEYFYENATLNGEKVIPNVFRIVTGNYRVEPISVSNNQSQLGLKYKLNKNATLVFLTLTPDGVSDIDVTYNTFIGVPQQQIRVSNTFFDPKTIEIELTDVDLKTISLGLFGDQVFNYEKSMRTYFDDSGAIYKQFDEYTEKNTLGEDIKKIKKERDEIDFGETL